MNDRTVAVVFADKNLESDFEKLKSGTTEEKRLYKCIKRDIEDLKKSRHAG